MEIEKKKTAKADAQKVADQKIAEQKADSQKQPAGRSWEHIESDLKDALNTWSDLTEELADKMSPEEAQLQEIKSLLGTLRDKLKEFSDDSTDSLNTKPATENASKHTPPPPHNKLPK